MAVRADCGDERAWPDVLFQQIVLLGGCASDNDVTLLRRMSQIGCGCHSDIKLLRHLCRIALRRFLSDVERKGFGDWQYLQERLELNPALVAAATEVSKELDIAVTPAPDLRGAAQQSDVIVTCTPSKKYYLLKEYVTSGTFIAAIGADSHDKQELESSLLVGAKVVVDLLHQCAEVGEFHHALDAGLLTEEDVHGELGAVVAGQTPGRTSNKEITIFDATGTALQDTAAAVLAYQRAVEAGVGLVVRLPE